jgi:hypothetical protein
MTITGIIVSVKRKARLLIVRLAKEKIIVIGRKRGRMEVVRTKKLMDSPAVIRRNDVSTIWQPG